MNNDNKIDVTWLIFLAGPFATYIFLRVFWLFAGAAWSEPDLGAFLSLIIGFLAGGAATSFCYENNKRIYINKFWQTND